MKQAFFDEVYRTAIALGQVGALNDYKGEKVRIKTSQGFAQVPTNLVR
jgi:hypothetical protein